jgi:autotransporter-associated beta strand protein
LSAANINITGENTNATAGNAGINMSNAASSLAASSGVTLTSGGTGSGTSLVAAGNISVGTQLRITTPAAGSIAGVISGNGSLLKMGAGQTRLTAFDGTTYGTNIFSGGTTISQGSLLFGNGNGNYNKTAGTGAITLGDVNTGASNVALLIEKGKDSSQESGKLSRAITVTSNGTGTAMIGGATGTGAGWTAINGAITLNRDVIFNDSTSDRLSIDGKITGTGNITLTGYRLTMSSSVQNDFVGSFTVSAGSILQSAANVNLAFAQSHNLIVNGDWRLYSANPSINSLTGSGTVTTYSGSPLLSIGNNNGGGVFSGVMSGALSLTKNGTGTQILSGANSFTGTTTINGGTLQIGNAGTSGALGTGVITNNSALVFNRTDTALVVGAKISGAGTVTQAGTGTTTLSANNDWSGSATVSAGTLQIGNGGTTGTLGTSTSVTSNGTLAFKRSDNISMGQKITGTGGLTQAGTGKVTLIDAANLNGVNDYSGVTTIVAGGTLEVGNGGSAGNLGSGTITDNGSLIINRSDAVAISKVISGSGSLSQSGSGTTTLSGINTYSGGTNVVTGILKIGDGTNNGQIGSNTVNIASGAVLDFNVKASSSANYSTTNTFTGTGTLKKSGGGTLTWGSASGVFAMTGGLIDVQAGSFIGSNSGNEVWTNNKASLNVAGGAVFAGVEGNIIVDALTGSGAVTSGYPSFAYGLTVGINNGSGTFSGAIQDSHGQSAKLTKTGTGTQILTGANSYTGVTTVSGGVLQVGNGGTSGTLGSGAVVDNASLVFNRSDALLVSNAISGTGTLTQAGAGTTTLAADNSYGGTTAVSGGTLQVGNGGSTGTLGAGAVTLSNNALLSYVRAADTSMSNNISGTGSVSASITGVGSDLTVSNAITLTGGTANLAADGNLSVTQGISTTNATASAVVLNAGKVTNAGTASGGDIQFSGSGSVGVGAGGRATLFTGSLAGSTGLGIATGNNRYNSDEQSTNYTAALSGGIYAIYREAPTLNLRFNDASKTYNAQAFTGGNGLSVVSGFVKDDTSTTFSGISYSGTAQNASNAGTYAISGTALNSQGYALSYTSGTLTVNKADLVLTGSREYDAGTTFAGQYLTATGVAGQTFSLSGAGDSSNLVSKHVAGNQSVALNSVTGLTLGTSSNGGLADNYNAISTTGSVVSLTTKAASVSATGTHVTYNGNTQQQSYTSSIIGGDVITVSGLGSGTNVGSYTSALSVAGADASNYHFSLTNADLVIDKANLTLSGSRAYDASTTFAGQHLTATGVNNEAFAVSGSGDVSNLSSKHVQTNQLLSSVAGLTVGASTGSNAGLSSNYNDLSTTGSSVSVTPRTLTVTGANTSVTYNGSAQTNAGATIVGKQGSDDFTVGGYGTGTNASTTSYADNLSVTGVGNTLLSNYDIHYTQGGLSIGKANLVLSGSRQYDSSTTFAGQHLTATGAAGQTFTVMGAGDASNLASQNVQSNQALSSITGLALGSSANGGLVDNYNNISTTGSSVSVSPRTLTVTGANTSVTYNGSAQTNAGATIVGKQGSDDFTVGGYGSGTNASTTSYADNLSVTGFGNTLLSNYDIYYSQGGLSIGKANLVLSGSRQYDASTTFAGQYLAATGVAGETFSVLGLGDASNLLSKNVADNQGVSLNDVTGLNLGTSTNGGLAVNYNALSSAGSSVRLTTKALAAAAAVADKVYDGNQLAVLGDLSGSGVVAGDHVIFQATSALFSDKNVSRNAEGQVLDKNVTVSGLSLSGADAGNYVLSANSFTTQAKITPLQLSLQATAQDKTYDGTRAATGHVLWSGVLGTDSLAVSWGDVNFVSKDVARSATGQVLAKSVVFSNLQMSGQDAGNYSLPTAPVAALARITPKRLSIDGTSVVNKPQDGNTDAKTQVGRLTGLVDPEQLEVQAMASFDSAMAGSNKPVTVRYRLGDGANGGLGGNYELPDQVLMANIFAPAGGNSVQPIKPPVDGPLLSTDAATATVVQTESRDVCSSATPEKCNATPPVLPVWKFACRD